MSSLSDVEQKIATLFQDEFKVRGWSSVIIKVHDAGGAQSFDGSFRRGWLDREYSLRDSSTGELVGFATDDAVSDLLFALHHASRNELLGPWYYAELTIKPRRSIAVNYWWEGTPVKTLSDLVPSDLGFPVFPFKRELRASLLREWREFDLVYAIGAYVSTQVPLGGHVSDIVLDLFATNDWLADTNNGSHDQYFARSTDCFGAGIGRSTLLPRVHRMIKRLNESSWFELFEEAVSLWSHFNRDVDEARLQLGIKWVPRKETSDIDARFFSVSMDIHNALCRYIKDHIDEIATTAS